MKCQVELLVQFMEKSLEKASWNSSSNARWEILADEIALEVSPSVSLHMLAVIPPRFVIEIFVEICPNFSHEKFLLKFQHK